MTKQLSLLTLAKQGDANAIAAMMNRSLQTKGMAAKASIKDGCLQVMLESAQINSVPEPQAVVEFIRKGITGLAADSIKSVKVCGRQVGEDFPNWEREFEIASMRDKSATSMQATASLLQASTSNSKHILKSQTSHSQKPRSQTSHSQKPRSQKPRSQQPSNAYTRTDLISSSGVVLLSCFSLSIAAVVLTALRGSNFNPSPQSQVDKTSQAEAKQNIKAINRGQQAFYLEKDAFAPTVAVLAIGVPSETTNYNYKVADVDQTKAISIAVAKVSGLKSYIGAVFAVKTTDGLNITVAGTCVTDNPPKTSPNLPQLIGQDIKCPSDAFDVSR